MVCNKGLYKRYLEGLVKRLPLRTSHLTPYTSHLTYHNSHITPDTLHLRSYVHLTLRTSHLTPHTSHLTPFSSHLTLHISYLPPATFHITPHLSHLRSTFDRLHPPTVHLKSTYNPPGLFSWRLSGALLGPSHTAENRVASCTQDSISSNGYFVMSKPLNLMRPTIACLQFHLAQVEPPISCDSDSCFESPRPCLSCCRHACQTSPFRCILLESAWCTSSGLRGHISGQLL